MTEPEVVVSPEHHAVTLKHAQELLLEASMNQKGLGTHQHAWGLQSLVSERDTRTTATTTRSRCLHARNRGTHVTHACLLCLPTTGHYPALGRGD